MAALYDPYTLPTIDFVGGETQDLAFHIYFYIDKKPLSLTGCTCSFSIVNFMNKVGVPVLIKPMRAIFNNDNTMDNVLTVTLSPPETVQLSGKYIYQISMRDIDGDIEIPKQGILFITNNINKNFIHM